MLAISLSACRTAAPIATPPSSVATPSSPGSAPPAPVSTAPPALPAALTSDPALRTLHFERMTLSAVPVWVARDLPQRDTFARWKAARAHYPTTGLYPVLVSPHFVEESDTRRLAPLPSFDRDAFVAKRAAALAKWPSSARMVAELPTATPSEDPYEEASHFEPTPDIPTRVVVLVLLPEKPWEVVRHFGPDGLDGAPSDVDTAGMMRRWNERLGAEPIYVDASFMELVTERQPQTLAEQRALAQEVHATCPSNREAFGSEAPSRLLRRIQAKRWVCWWFVE
ncbi:Hypothetical protein A7982_07244 [Minicystis rosea]|nr:Hypothetical protein A7982_07244 [Minicystis rosea]